MAVPQCGQCRALTGTMPKHFGQATEATWAWQ
jgi:hypothetical protein